MFEWKWSDIADECERFLSKMGYAGQYLIYGMERIALCNSINGILCTNSPLFLKFCRRPGIEIESVIFLGTPHLNYLFFGRE